MSRYLLLLLFLLVPAMAGAADVPPSRFLPRLDPTPAPSAAPGAEPLKVRWDFSKPCETPYRFTHFTQTAGMANGIPAPEGETETRGILTVRSAGKGVGDLALEPQEVIVKAGGRTISTGGPSDPVVVEGVAENGKVTGARSEREALIALLFPLPPEALRTGNSSSRGVQLPMALGPVRVTVQGTAVTRLTGWADVGGVKCARLETELDLTKVLTPPGTLGVLHAAGRGGSVFYWDPAGRRFTRGALALRIQGRYGYDRPNPIEGLPPIRLSAEADLDQIAEIELAPPAAE